MSRRLTRPEKKKSSHEESLTVAMFMNKELCDHAMNAWWPCLLKSRDILFLSNENICYRMKILLPNENISLNGNILHGMKTFYQMKMNFIEWKYFLYQNENIFYRMDIYILSNKNILSNENYFYRMRIIFIEWKIFLSNANIFLSNENNFLSNFATFRQQ